MLIETEKSSGAEKAGTIITDPFDMKNLGTLRRLRAEKTVKPPRRRPARARAAGTS
jgi:hypothetical protein